MIWTHPDWTNTGKTAINLVVLSVFIFKIMHCDLAASNVMVDKDFICKITNFNLGFPVEKYGHLLGNKRVSFPHQFMFHGILEIVPVIMFDDKNGPGFFGLHSLANGVSQKVSDNGVSKRSAKVRLFSKLGGFEIKQKLTKTFVQF